MKQLGIILVLLLVVAGGAGLYFAYDNNLFAIGGLNVLSLDTVQFNSNDPTVGGEAFLLYISSDGSSQHVYGVIDSEDISDDGVQASEDLRIDLIQNQQSCNYVIQNQQDTVKNADIVFQDRTINQFALDDLSDDCMALNPTNDFVAHKETGSLYYYYYCIETFPIASKGNILFDTLVSDSDIEVTIDNDVYVTSISNTGTTTASLAGGDIHARFTGFLNTGEQCPSSSDQGVIAMYQNGWRITDEQDWDDYRNYELSGYANCLSDWANGISSLDPSVCINTLNGYANIALSEENFESNGGTEASSSGSTVNGIVELPLNRLIGFETFNLRVKADRLGVFLPVGDPQITNMGCGEFQSGDSGNLYVSVKNKGTVDASFDVQVSCDSPLNVGGTTQTLNFGEGETRTVNFPLSAIGSGSEQCTVTASDVENPSNRDSESVTCSFTDLVTCDSGSYRCVGDVQEVCSGGEWQPTGSDSCVEADPPEDEDMIFVVKIIALIVFLGLSITGLVLAKRVNPWFYAMAVLGFVAFSVVFISLTTIWIAVLTIISLISFVVGWVLYQNKIATASFIAFGLGVILFLIAVLLIILQSVNLVDVLLGGGL